MTLIRAHFALSDHHPDVALEGSAQAIALAREIEAVDVEMLALALKASLWSAPARSTLGCGGWMLLRPPRSAAR